MPHVLEKSFTSAPVMELVSGSISAAHGEPHPGAGGCLEETVSLWEAHAGGPWQDLERGVHSGASLQAGLVTPAGPVPEELQPMGKTQIVQVSGGLSAVGRTLSHHPRVGEEHEESSPLEEKAAETVL